MPSTDPNTHLKVSHPWNTQKFETKKAHLTTDLVNSGLEKNLNHGLPFGQAALKFSLGKS